MAQDLCSINQPNSGAPDCDKTRQIPRYLVIGTKEFLAADYSSQAAFKAAFKAASLLDRYSSGKLIVLPIIADVQNSTEANKEGTLNQGFKEVLQEGFPVFNYKVQISNYHAQILRSLNGQNVKVFTQDSAKMIWGTGTATPGFRGESAKIFVGGDTFGDGQASKAVLINVAYLDPVEFYGSSTYYDPGFSVADYGRLKDVTLFHKVAYAGANVLNLSAAIPTGRVGKTLDVYLDYATPIANVNKWLAFNVKTGAAFTITSVAQNAAGYWVVTLDATSFTALASGDQVQVRWVAPSVLDAAGVTGVESVDIVITKP